MLPHITRHPAQLSQEFGSSGFADPSFSLPRPPDRLLPFCRSELLRAIPVENHGPQEPRLVGSNFSSQGILGQYNDPSEHMLRRKTPNGTLAAGYDGTPVQWSSKAPALKHVVRPISQTSSCHHGADTTPPVQEQHLCDRSGSFPWNYQPSTHFGKASDAEGAWSNNTDPGRRTYPPSLPNPSHNILGHLSTHKAATYPLNNAMQIPTVLQPAYQPSPGPTASNDGGLYGPYWPDGRFVPYRPAAFRDQGPHYPSQAISFNRGFQHQSKSTGDGPPRISHSTYTYDHVNRARNPSFSKADSVLQGPGLAFELQPQGQQPLYSNATLYSTLPDATQTPSGQPASKASNTRFKEKTLSWAHTIYVDLLTFLHQSKKQNTQARQSQGFRHYSKNSIYPKPPRQPAHNFETSNWAGTYRPADEIDASSRERDIGSTSSQRSCGANPGSNFARSQSTGTLLDTGHPKFSNSDIPHYLSGFHASYYPTGSPMSKAKEALEMLTTLCEQSSWCWIDGMLLGGCLAYGLEEYHKALDWYSKIIALDPM